MTFLTESEARGQVCPHFTFVVNESAVHQFGHSAIYVHNGCTASACKMAWRWKDGDTDFREVGEEPKGYCGLAGRPHEPDPISRIRLISETVENGRRLASQTSSSSEKEQARRRWWWPFS